MGSRERKRAERQKRKRRSAERPDSGAPVSEDSGGIVESRSEAKNRQAREQLEPLREGERPLVVTIGAVLSTLLLISTVAGYVLWSALRSGPRPALFGVLVFAALTGSMAYGMWKVRYWAVLGFQVFLVFFILAGVRGLIAATLTVLQAVVTGLLVAGAGTLFFFMVRGMARIQMPERRPHG